MKNNLFYLIISLISLHALISCQQNLDADLLIRNVQIIDVLNGSVLNNQDLLIKSGQILLIQQHGKNNFTASTIVDGTNKYLIPGLFDCHVHTTNYQEDFPRFMHYGITGVFITGGSVCTDAYYEQMRKAGQEDTIYAPRVFHTSQHFTMEGRHPVKTYGGNNWQEGKTVFFLHDTMEIKSLVAKVAQQPILGIKVTI